MNLAATTSLLEQAHAQATRAFSQYSLRQQVAGCPCCVNATDRAELLQGNLQRYAFKAMTTWGNETDFKHFLPAILKSLTPDYQYYPTTVHNGACDLSCLADKLRYAHWRNWLVSEQQAVLDCLRAWWRQCLALVQQEFAAFIAGRSADGWGNSVGPAYDELTKSDLLPADWLQATWWEAIQPVPGQTAAEYVQSSRFLALVDWLDRGQYERGILPASTPRYLEAGFFVYADRTPDLAQRISNLLYLLESPETLPAAGPA